VQQGDSTPLHLSFPLLGTEDTVCVPVFCAVMYLTLQEEAVAKYGADGLDVYKSTFVNMFYTLWDVRACACRSFHVCGHVDVYRDCQSVAQCLPSVAHQYRCSLRHAMPCHAMPCQACCCTMPCLLLYRAMPVFMPGSRGQAQDIHEGDF
jgi:hypothetical protein